MKKILVGILILLGLGVAGGVGGANKTVIRSFILELGGFSVGTEGEAEAESNFFKTAIIRHGGSAIGGVEGEADIASLAKFDLVMVNSKEFDRIGTVGGSGPTCTRYHANATTWNLLCDANEDIIILAYYTLPNSAATQDLFDQEEVTSTNRYSVTRGHSTGVKLEDVSYYLADNNSGVVVATADTIQMNGLIMASDEDVTASAVGAMCVFQYQAADVWMATCNDFTEATPP